jgi:hypothetical protein
MIVGFIKFKNNFGQNSVQRSAQHGGEYQAVVMVELVVTGVG